MMESKEGGGIRQSQKNGTSAILNLLALNALKDGRFGPTDVFIRPIGTWNMPR